MLAPANLKHCTNTLASPTTRHILQTAN